MAANFIVGPDGSILPAFNPQNLPTLQQLASKAVKAPGTGFTMGPGSAGFAEGVASVAPETGIPLLEGPAGAAQAGRWAKSLPILVAVLAANAGLSQYAKAQGEEIDPNSGTLAQLRHTMAGRPNPNYSDLGNRAAHIAGAPTMVGMGLEDMVKGAMDWATTPVGNKEKPGAQFTDPNSAVAKLIESLPKSDSGQPQIFDKIGRTAVPQMGMPVGVDTTETKAWLDKVEPKAPDAAESAEDRKMTILAGLAQGIANIDTTKNLGPALAQVAAGGAMGIMQSRKEAKAEKQQYQLAMQQYANLRAGASLDMAKMDAGLKNKMTEVAFHNAMLKHQAGLQEIQRNEPKYLGIQGSLAIYQTKDPATGQIQIKTFNLGQLAIRQAATALQGGQLGPGTDAFHSAAAADAAPMNGAFGYYSNITGELFNNGMLPYVLGEKAYNVIEAEATKRAASAPGDEKSKGLMYNHLLIGQAAGLMMQNPALVNNAQQYSIFARGLLPFLRAPQDGK